MKQLNRRANRSSAPLLPSRSALITKCNYQDTYTTCAQLANMGYLPKGVQSFEADKLTGEGALPPRSHQLRQHEVQCG